MIESSTPALADLADYGNVTDLLIRRAVCAPTHIAFEVPSAEPGAPWRPITTGEFLDEVRALAKGFIAVGVGAGEAVAIMAPTRYEWAVADLASWFAGAVVVPIYETSSPAQVRGIVADAGVRLAIGGSAAHTDLLRDAMAGSPTPSLGVWSMGDRGLDELVARGTDVCDEALERRRVRAVAGDPATIVYTSGTTGEPKGAVLTHENLLAQVLNIAAAYREIVHEGGNTVIFLPLAHVLARGLQLICLASGMRIAHLSDTTAVVSTLAALRPTFLVAVPRVLQKIQSAAAGKAADKGMSSLWRRAEQTAVQWGRRAEARDGVTTTRAGARAARHSDTNLRFRHALFDALFFRRLRAVMGGRVDYILSGGATLDAELSLFFRGIGVPIIEGYGLTETTAPLTGNLPGRIASGSVGSPLPGSTVRISETGEVLAAGAGVFAGYRNPAHNEDAFTDGFFRTGDLGRIDAQGRLFLIGRVKDVIVTSNGKTIVPTVWEGAVESSPLVSHAIMVGEAKPYLSALLILDADATEAWAAAQGVRVPRDADAELRDVADPLLRAQLQSAVDAANSLVARSEQVRRFSIVFADLEDRALVTPTMKIKRLVVLDRASAALDTLYS